MPILLQRVGSGAVRTASGVSSGSDGSGSKYLVMPQPVLVPRLGSTDEEGWAPDAWLPSSLPMLQCPDPPVNADQGRHAVLEHYTHILRLVNLRCVERAFCT